MASGQHTQIQNGLVALTIAGRAATPFVIADAFHLLEQRLMSGIIARENRLARLPTRMPLTQPEIAWSGQPVQKCWESKERLPSPGVFDGIGSMSQSIPYASS